MHASCVALDGRGVLLVGPPGSGKSDLALRLIDDGGRLVADDRVVLRRCGAALLASAPPAILGRIEVRGLGLCSVAPAPETSLSLVVALVSGGEIKRLPEAGACAYLRVDLPLMRVAAFEASAAAKIRLAMDLLSRGVEPER